MDESQPSNDVVDLAPDHQVITISFNGQVFIFDGVPTQKVQAVLLLLGGFTFGRKPMDTAPKVSDVKRQAFLDKYRYKRDRRCYDRKIRYNVRHEVAIRQQRRKGQFAPKKNDLSLSPSCDLAEELENGLEIVCSHCGICSSETPLMRKGPDGPKSLCNACGLRWANTGMLPRFPKIFRSNNALAIYVNDDYHGTETQV